MKRPAQIAAALASAALVWMLPVWTGLGNEAAAGTLDVSGMNLVFDEPFAALSVSSYGPGTRWIAHTPWHGDFGDAAFADPAPGFPFSRTQEGLRIELRRQPDGRWQSGLLASTDPAGVGFALRYGYFEMRAKLPSGPGVWPAFWLDSRPPPGSLDPSIEIDVIEFYGKFSAAFNSTVTVWTKPGMGANRSQMQTNTVPPGALSTAFHDYGVDVEPDWTVFYLDRTEIWRVATPPEHRHGLTILVDLGLGGGWSIDETPNPSFMAVEYIRVYSAAGTALANPSGRAAADLSKR